MLVVQVQDTDLDLNSLRYTEPVGVANKLWTLAKAEIFGTQSVQKNKKSILYIFHYFRNQTVSMYKNIYVVWSKRLRSYIS